MLSCSSITLLCDLVRFLKPVRLRSGKVDLKETPCGSVDGTLSSKSVLNQCPSMGLGDIAAFLRKCQTQGPGFVSSLKNPTVL